MSDFIILTDSSADLDGEMAQRLDVQVLPLSFTIGGRTYHNYPDNREMDPHLFYERLRAGEAVRRRTPQGFAPHRSGQRHDGQAQQNSSKRSGDHAHGLIHRSWV